MKHIKCISLMLIVFLLIIGCSGNNANLRNLSESESKAIQQELLDNWSDYDISYNWMVIVFDPKNDDKKILVDNYLSRVKDQETWTQIVNGSIIRVWGLPIREIWVHNQFYGYIRHGQGSIVAAKIVDENTVRLFVHQGNWGRGDVVSNRFGIFNFTALVKFAFTAKDQFHNYEGPC